jgi:hypothetical protein
MTTSASHPLEIGVRCGVGANRIGDLGRCGQVARGQTVGSDIHDATVANRNRAGPGMGSVDAVNSAPAQHQVGGDIRRLCGALTTAFAAGEGEGEEEEEEEEMAWMGMEHVGNQQLIANS